MPVRVIVPGAFCAHIWAIRLWCHSRLLIKLNAYLHEVARQRNEEMSDYSRIQVEEADGITTLKLLDGQLSDLLVQSELQDEMLDVVDKQHPKKVLIDFGRVLFCASASINGLLRFRRDLLEQGGELRIFGMTKNVREAFQILNLEGTLFKIFDSAADAKASW